MRRLLWTLAALATPLLAPATLSAQVELLNNGGFELGLTGWNTGFAPGSNPAAGRYYGATGTTTPVSSSPTPGAHSGLGYAVSDMSGPGAGFLTQSFTLAFTPASATLSFWMFVRDRSGLGPLGSNFDFTGSGPNQHAIVDLLFGTPDPFTTSASDIAASFFYGVGPADDPWRFFSFDLGALAAGTYTLRFAEVDNQLFLNHGVDDVSLLGTQSVVPEPATLLLLGTGLMGMAGAARKRRREDPISAIS